MPLVPLLLSELLLLEVPVLLEVLWFIPGPLSLVGSDSPASGVGRGGEEGVWGGGTD